MVSLNRATRTSLVCDEAVIELDRATASLNCGEHGVPLLGLRRSNHGTWQNRFGNVVVVDGDAECSDNLPALERRILTSHDESYGITGESPHARPTVLLECDGGRVFFGVTGASSAVAGSQWSRGIARQLPNPAAGSTSSLPNSAMRK